jgi:hypothetical protein
MKEGYISLALLFPPLGLTIAACLMWTFHDSSAAIQTSKWQKIVTIFGLLVLSADVVLSAGYVFYEFSARIVKFSIFDACSSLGALLYLIGNAPYQELASLPGDGTRERQSSYSYPGSPIS